MADLVKNRLDYDRFRQNSRELCRIATFTKLCLIPLKKPGIVAIRAYDCGFCHLSLLGCQEFDRRHLNFWR